MSLQETTGWILILLQVQNILNAFTGVTPVLFAVLEVRIELHYVAIYIIIYCIYYFYYYYFAV